MYCKVASISDNNLDISEAEDIASIFLNTNFWIGQDSQGIKQLISKLESEIQSQYIGYNTVLKV